MKDKDIEKLYLESLRKAGTKIEDLARSMYASFVLFDYNLYKQVEIATGTYVAKKVHKKARLRYVPWVVKEAFEKLKVSEVKNGDVSTVGYIASLIYERTSCPVQIKEDSADHFECSVLRCPMVSFSMGLFNEELGCPYHESLSEVCIASVNELVRQLGLSNDIEVVMDKFIFKGDDSCRIVLQQNEVGCQ
ncbi:hypothetical protein ACFLWH_01750 [Chloroflexota bacterium]